MEKKETKKPTNEKLPEKYTLIKTLQSLLHFY